MLDTVLEIPENDSGKARRALTDAIKTLSADRFMGIIKYACVVCDDHGETFV